MNNDLKLCSNCGSIGHYKINCDNCDNRIYCSQECSDEDWNLKIHYLDCHSYGLILESLKDSKKYDEWKQKGAKFGVPQDSSKKTVYYSTVESSRVGFAYITKRYQRESVPVFDAS